MQQDQERLRRCAQGDSAAWEEFLRRHGPTIHAMARHTLRRVLGRVNDADAENIVQGVLVQLLDRGGRKLLSYEGRSDVDTWLKTVTSRFALNYIRGEKSRGSLRFRPIGNVDPAAKPLKDSDIEPYLKGLKPVERTVLKMHFVNGLGYDEIARVLGLPKNSVASHIHRAGKKIRKDTD